MEDRTKDLLVNVLSMTKGELVDVVERLEGNMRESLNKTIDERDEALARVDSLLDEIDMQKATIAQLKKTVSMLQEDIKLNDLQARLKRTDLTENERAKLLKEVTDMIRRKK